MPTKPRDHDEPARRGEFVRRDEPAVRRGEPVVTSGADDRDPPGPETTADLNAEIDGRSPDGGDGDRYIKRYVAPAPFPPEDFDHEPNMANVRQEAVNQGVRPTDHEVTFDGAETSEDGLSVVLSYSMRAVPAHAAQGVEAQRPDDVQ